MPWAVVGTAIAGAATSAIVGDFLAPDQPSGGGAGSAAAAADPFASQRAQYMPQLQSLMGQNQNFGTGQAQSQLDSMLQGNFNSSDPSYRFRFDQGMDAVNRSAGASGMLNSGNRLTALMNYGQGMASTEYSAQFGRLSNEAGRQYSQNSADYSNKFSRLSQLSGANSGQPGAAGQIMANQNAQQTQAAGAVASQLGNAAGAAFGSWMSQPSGGSGSSWNTGGGTMNNPSAYTSDNSAIPYAVDNNNYSPTW